VEYLVCPPPAEGDESATPQTHYRRATQCAEVFLCEVAVLLEAFTKSDAHMGKFLDFLRQPMETADPVRSGYFCRIFLMLARSHADRMTGIMPVSDFMAAVIDRLGNDSFKDALLVPIMCSEPEELAHQVAQWLLAGGLIDGLVKAFTSSNDSNQQQNIAEVLHELCVQSKTCLEVLQQKPQLELLLGAMADAPKTTIANSMHILNGLVGSVQDEEEEFEDPSDPKAQEVSPLVTILCEHMPALAATLAAEGEGSIATPAETITPPLGHLRLTALRFFALIFRTFKVGKNAAALNDQMISHQVLVNCVQLLFAYPWHNIAHIPISEVITSCLYSECDKLRVSLVDDAELPRRIMDAFDALPPPPEEGCAPDIHIHRPGNFGTVIAIAAALAESAGNHEELRTRLGDNERWQAVVTGPLKEEQRKQSLELGCGNTPNLSRFGLNDDSTSSDEDRDPDNNSSGSSDEDDDPLKSFATAADDDDKFRANTTFVSHDADAWQTHEITYSSGSEWVANFDAAEDPWSNATVSDEEAAAWKADFEACDSFGGNAAFSVEDPFANATPEEDAQFEADFSCVGTSAEPQGSDFEASASQDSKSSMHVAETCEVVEDLSEEDAAPAESNEAPATEVPEDHSITEEIPEIVTSVAS